MSIRSGLITLAVVLAFPLAAAAQDAPAAPAPAPAQAQPAHRAHHNGWRAALRTLALTPDQQRQIRGFAHQRTMANAGADAPTRRANGKLFRREVAGVLTPEQRAQFRAALAQQRAATAPQ